MCQAIQSRCTDDVDRQSNQKYEQYDACPQDHTSYLTAQGKHQYRNFTTQFPLIYDIEMSPVIALYMGNI